MKYDAIIISGADLEDRWDSDNQSAAEVAGLDRIDPSKNYVVSWPYHVLIPRFNGDCIIRECNTLEMKAMAKRSLRRKK